MISWSSISGSLIIFKSGSVNILFIFSGFTKLAPKDFWWMEAGIKSFNCWLDVKYILDASSSISSIVCTHPLPSVSSNCPFLITIIGSPVSPSLLHLFLFSSNISSLILVDPKRIEFPNLPSIIVSPS